MSHHDPEKFYLVIPEDDQTKRFRVGVNSKGIIVGVVSDQITQEERQDLLGRVYQDVILSLGVKGSVTVEDVTE